MPLHDNGFLERLRETIQCVLIVLCCLWQSLVALLGLLLFLILIRVFRYSVWSIFLVGLVLALTGSFFVEWQSHFGSSFFELMHASFEQNMTFWKIVFSRSFNAALRVVYQQGADYVLGCPILFAGLFGMTEWIPNSTHEWELKPIQRGRESSSKQHSLNWKKYFSKPNKQSQEGTLLGFSEERVMRTNFGDTTAEILREHSDSLVKGKFILNKLLTL